MSQAVICVENLSKKYEITVGKHRDDTLRDQISNSVRSLFLRNGARGQKEIFWALEDVSFEVKPGEVLGIIGRNGAGKSTLLKILSRITVPSSGFAEIHGRVGALLEVGTGFHPELTGGENIYLNGAILGMKKDEIKQKFDEIVAFAEVEKFIDTPVKRYSSGMYVRLAFAVAAHLESEILIVDEVLAVGDARFQRKCLGKMSEVAGEGRTVLFVSHNLAAVSQLCSRGILLSNGLIACEGSIDEVVDTYVKAVTNFVDEIAFPEREGSAASFTRFCLRNNEGQKTSRFSNSEPINLEIEYVVRQTLTDNHLWMTLDGADGLRVIKSGDDDIGTALAATRTSGRYITRVFFPGGLLNEGIYRFRVVLGKQHGPHHDDQFGGYFEIKDVTTHARTFLGKRNGVLLLPLAWSEEKIDF